MKIMNMKRGTMVYMSEVATVPPGAPQMLIGDAMKVGSLGGMYVNGTTEDGNMVYVAAWTEVEPFKD